MTELLLLKSYSLASVSIELPCEALSWNVASAFSGLLVSSLRKVGGGGEQEMSFAAPNSIV